MVTRSDALAFDDADLLRAFRDEFVIQDPETCYLDGNSLGRLPRATREAVIDFMDNGWAAKVVDGWADWIDMAESVGDLLGRAALGAAPAQVLVQDDNLFINCGWGTGGFKATPGSGWVMAHTVATGEPHALNAAYSLDRFRTGHLIDEHGAAGVAH